MRRLVLTSLLLAVPVLGACGGSDDDTKTVSSGQIPFTFEVPESFKEREIEQGSSQGTPPLIALGPDRYNLIDVRQSAPREVPLDQVQSQIKSTLAQLGFDDAQAKREKHAGREMVVFDIDNKVGGKSTNSKLYFFAGGGATWELECQSTSDRRDDVDDACADALGSIEFK